MQLGDTVTYVYNSRRYIGILKAVGTGWVLVYHPESQKRYSVPSSKVKFCCKGDYRVGRRIYPRPRSH